MCVDGVNCSVLGREIDAGYIAVAMQLLVAKSPSDRQINL